MLQQIDNADTESIITEDISQHLLSSTMKNFDMNLTKSGEERPFVKADDLAVGTGIDRITRLLQIKRIMLDHVEGLLFPSSFKATSQICLIHLA